MFCTYMPHKKHIIDERENDGNNNDVNFSKERLYTENTSKAFLNMSLTGLSETFPFCALRPPQSRFHHVHRHRPSLVVHRHISN